MKVSDVMKSKFLFFYAEDPIYQVARKLEASGQREAPVIWHDKFIGMISFSGIAAALTRRKLVDNLTQEGAAAIRPEPIRKYIYRTPMFMRITLDPDMPVSKAIAILAARNAEIVPVVDRKQKLLGVVHSKNIRDLIMDVLSFGLSSAAKKSEEEKWGDGHKLNTTIDRIHKFVVEKGTVSAEQVAKQFKLPVPTIEEYAQSLEKHGLLRIEYTVLGEMVIKRVS